MHYEGAGIWLFRKLRALHLTEHLPAAFQESVRQDALARAARRLQVEAEGRNVADLLGHAGIQTVFIKGIARCALAARYPWLDARATSDVDVLVDPATADAAVSALMQHGYVPANPDGPSRPGHHHRPALRRDSVCVEIHSSTSTRVAPEVAWQRTRGTAESVDWQGIRVLVPSATELAWNAIAHALEDELSGFRLARWLELAALVAGEATIDWDTIDARGATAEACDATAVPHAPERVLRRWITGALALVDPAARPSLRYSDPFDVAAFLAWRLDILRCASRLGRAATTRLLEEGGRAMVGLPREPAPPDTLWYARTRRAIAGRGSRLAHRVWRAARAT